MDDRAALNGILFVLTTGIPWEEMPQELGFGNGMTCWRRLRDWQALGVWGLLHLTLLMRLRQHDQIDWSRASIDGAVVATTFNDKAFRPALLVKALKVARSGRVLNFV